MSSDPFSSAGTGLSGPVQNTREASAKRDGMGRYLIPKLPKDYKEQFKAKGFAEPDGGDTAWTRATTFAKSVSDSFALAKWGERMVAKGMALRPDLVLSAAATPVTDKGRLDSIAEQAKDAAASRAAANLGDAYHNLVQDMNQGRAIDMSVLPAEAKSALAAYKATLEAYGWVADPQYIERCVVNTTFGVAGTFDSILGGKMADLKTGRDLSYGWGEIAIQQVVYATADAIFDWDRKVFLPLPAVDPLEAIILHMPVGAGKVDPYRLDLTEAFEAAELCGKVRAWRKASKKIAVPLKIGDVPGEREDSPDLSPQGGAEPNTDLAPLAGPGQKGCSVCRRTGHRKGSPKCLGAADPARTVFDNLPEPSQDVPADNQPNLIVDPNSEIPGTLEDTEEEPRCSGHPGAGWTNRGDGVFVCGECGLRSAAIPTTVDGLPADSAVRDEEPTDNERTPIGEQDGQEEISDPFAEPEPEPPLWANLISNADSKAELRDIRANAQAAGAWTPELQAIGIQRVKELDKAG